MDRDPIKRARHGETETKTTMADKDKDEEEKVEAVKAEHPNPAMEKELAVPPHDYIRKGAEINSMEQYAALYKRSIEDTDGFWGEMAKKHLDWFEPFTSVQHGSFAEGDIAWFLQGKLNACYNCIDRHIPTRGDKVALLWEGDKPSDVRRITYKELLRDVCRLSNALKRTGVRKGDTVCIYMPMIPEAVVAMLACTRIGAAHTVVFAGFSVEALRDRIIDGNCVAVITADEGTRGGKHVPLKKVVDRALLDTGDSTHTVKNVHSVIVFQHTHDKATVASFHATRDKWWHDVVAAERPYCPAEPMDSEDSLFLLFTSGSTGRPKGIQHTTAGYLLYAALTHRYVFDIKEDDVYACVADVGWITGHSYVVYGPLLNGSTTFLFESTPLFPDAGRYWDMVQRHKITVFYTSPTAIRSLMKFGPDIVRKYDRSSLRILGTVGEPINPEAWKWYNDVVGEKKATIVDTYWQTETGGHVITPLPGAIPTKAGSASLPFFGIEPVLLNEKGKEVQGNNTSGFLAIKKPWPGMLRTCWGDHNRFLQTYMTAYPGYYFTGDGAFRDQDGYYWITGRVDDVINVSGHRIGSAEIESALVSHPAVAESAVVGIPHDIKGQALFAYVTLKQDFNVTDLMHSELLLAVIRDVGSFAKPDFILITPGLPKTRSGKIMRRLLRKIACKETESLGDLSTLAEPQIIEDLIVAVNALYSRHAK